MLCLLLDLYMPYPRVIVNTIILNKVHDLQIYYYVNDGSEINYSKNLNYLDKVPTTQLYIYTSFPFWRHINQMIKFNN